MAISQAVEGKEKMKQEPPKDVEYWDYSKVEETSNQLMQLQKRVSDYLRGAVE